MMSSRASAPQPTRTNSSSSTSTNSSTQSRPHPQPQQPQYHQQYPQQPLTAAPSFSSSSQGSYGYATRPQPQTSSRPVVIPGYCKHSFKIIDSETTDLLWECEECASGPHWFIFECKSCRFKCCRVCCYNA